MSGGGDHPGANKRNREAAGMPKRAKRKKPYEDPAAAPKGSRRPPPPRTIGSLPWKCWRRGSPITTLRKNSKYYGER